MENCVVNIKRLRESAQLPSYATAGAAAMDLRADVEASIVLKAGERKIIPTGLAISLPSANYVAILCARSGLASKFGICLANGIGVIDSDYRGEIGVALYNASNQDFTIHAGDRIAQMMIAPVAIATLCEVDSLDETARGAGGFGSTGKQ
jgi:dUTP pyrophosphatase